MPIEGLLNEPAAVAPEKRLYLAGTPDVDEAVGVTLEAYRALGYNPDVDHATETMSADFNQVAGLGYDGRLIVKVPKQVSFDQILDAAEGKRSDGVPDVWVYKNLWVPGTEKKSYKAEELNRAPDQPVARLVLFNADKTTGVDPVLQHLNQPYDEKYAERDETTQLKTFEDDKREFETEYPGYDLASVDHRDFALIALMDRIRGVKSEDLILSRGFMRVLELGRRSVDGGSVVGRVYSDGGRLRLGWSLGRSYPDVGFGVSVGLNELNS